MVQKEAEPQNQVTNFTLIFVEDAEGGKGGEKR